MGFWIGWVPWSCTVTHFKVGVCVAMLQIVVMGVRAIAIRRARRTEKDFASIDPSPHRP